MQTHIPKIILTIFIFCHINCFSQKISPKFYNIINDSLLSIDEKDIEFQKLLINHKSEKKSDFLIGDSYEIIKWYWQQNWTSKAIELNKKNLVSIDSLNLSDNIFHRRNLYSLGYYQDYTFKHNDALITYKRLLDYKNPDTYAMKGAYQIAELYFVIGDYYLSRDYYYLSKTIAEKQNEEVFVILNAIGIGQTSKLINTSTSLNEGIAVLKNAISRGESVINNDTLNKTIEESDFHSMYNQLGNLYIDRLDYDFNNGKTYLEKALKIAIKLNDSELLNKTYNDLGVLYLKEKRNEAKLYFEKALKYDSQAFMKSLVHRNLSIHHLQFENYTLALNHIQTSLQALVYIDTSNTKNLPTKLDLSNSNAKFQLISALIDKAYVWLKLGNKNPNKPEYIEDAIATLELADFLAEQTRLDNSDYRSKLFWRKTASEIYLNATKACFLRNDPQKAFYFMEKNKALLLLEDISLNRTRNNSEIPDNITSNERKLKNKVEELKTLAITKNTDSIQSQLLLAKDDYNKFLNSINADYKFYFKTLKPAKVTTIDAFRKEFIKDNNACIEYILDDKEGYGILITKTDIKIFELENCKELKKYAIQYRNLVDKPFTNNTSIENYNSISNKIYKSLFPIEIQDLIKGKTLTIVPDYYLQNIPFESLTTSTEDKNYLITKNQINYAYSLSFLSENNKVKRENTNNIIAFAPIEFSSKLKSLPHTEDELKFIDKTFSAKVFLRENASKENFLKESNTYKIIHLASHASANDSISPWISFYNEKITTDEFYQYKNSAELVVLSACNTSLGELNIGEGVMSLSRSFFNTGAHTVMPTLWEVNDKASTELLSSFYKNIKQGQNKSLALHNAKLKYLDANSLSESSPYYWASFVLIGDTRNIEIESNLTFIYYLITGFILLIIIIYYFRRKNS